MERVLQERLHGPEHRGLFYIIGKKELDTDWASYGELEETLKYRKLVIDYEVGEDPDAAFSTIPYEKGGNFIFYLGLFRDCFIFFTIPNSCPTEGLLGLEKFLTYAKKYANDYWGKSITTDEWKDHLYSYFGKDNEALKKVNWTVSILNFHSIVFSLMLSAFQAWLEGTRERDKLPANIEWNDALAKPAWQLASDWNNWRGSHVSELPFQETDLDAFDANQTCK
jgi:leukotriene-A4 hydrolase